jgi:catechol 2,3-dioxygenase-like lactoylglutathione lyase family enzyme
MPNLENLRKRAKRYLRWHRGRHYPVAAQIRMLLPRYRGLTDEDILASRFKLNDAQEMVARKIGFESWEALRKGLQTMDIPNAHALTPPVLLRAEPQLFVSDIGASCEFYAGKLGFSVVFTYGEPPFYGQVARDGVRLNFRCVSSPVVDPRLRDEEELLAASITLEDAKSLFLEYQAAGVTFRQTLRTEPWGARTFIVRDPDGNLLLFSGRGE